jgi:hypothetical protein
MNKKKVYNIILNSKDIYSYSGSKENASYYIDFNSIMDAHSLQSSYLVKFRIKSLNMSSLLYDPTTNLVVLNLGFMSPFHNMANMNRTNIAGILSFVWESTPTATTSRFSCDTPIDYNPPVYVDNLNSVVSLSLNLYDVIAGANFSNMADYVCIVSFEEQ